jgi:hypothetical protein
MLLGVSFALGALFGVGVVFWRAHRAQSRPQGLMTGAALLAWDSCRRPPWLP